MDLKFSLLSIPRPSNKHKKYLQSAVCAHAGPRYVPDMSSHKMSPADSDNTAIILDLGSEAEPEDDNKVYTWTGGVTNHIENDPEAWIDLSNDPDSDDEIEELEGVMASQ
jgi:hypothetical protein